MKRSLVRMLMLLLAWTPPGALWAQAVPAAPESVGDEQPVSREVWPRLIYLLDGEGKPTIPYLDFDWQKFNLLSGQVQPTDDVPHVLSSLQIQGNTQRASARLQVTLVVRCLTDEPQWVPIKFADCHFLKPPTTASGAEVLARYVEAYDEYELRIEGKTDEDVTVQLELERSIARTGTVSKLRLALPRASLSTFELTIDETDIEARAAGELPFQMEPQDAATVLRLTGLVPKFELQWMPKRSLSQPSAASVSVNSVLDVRVESTGTVTTEALLQLSAFQQPIDRARLRLPPGAQLSESQSTGDGYTIVPVETSEGQRQAVEVTFASASQSPPEVRLLTELTPSQDNAQLAVAQLEVVDAVSQVGQINLFALGEQQLQWQLGPFAHRTATAEGAMASFIYYRPHQLNLSISRQPPVVTVEPSYIVRVTPSEATVQAIYRCNTGGAPISELAIDLQGWSFEGLGQDPQNVIGDEDELRAEGGRLAIPLSDAPNEFELAILARRPFEEDLERIPTDSSQPVQAPLTLTMPYPPDVNKVLKSTVVVASAANVVLAPSGPLDGYGVIDVPDRLVSELGSESVPLCLRLRADGPPLPLSFAAARLERRLQVDCETDIIAINSEGLRVQQRMHWEVKEVALPKALLTMPSDVYLYGNPQITVDNKPTVFKRFVTLGDAILGRYLVQVDLDRSLGSFDLAVTYDWENTEPTMDDVLVDLVLPQRDATDRAESLQFTNRLRKPRIQGYQVRLSSTGNDALDDPWTGAGNLAVLEAEVEARSDALTAQLPLTITQVGPPEVSTTFETLVDQCWYQSWYTQTERSDRAVFRVREADQTLRVELPEDTDFRKLHAWIDGNKAEFVRLGTASIELVMPPNQSVHVVELRYARDRRRAHGLLSTQVPLIEGADMIGQWYWHVVLPRGEALVSWPRSLTRAYQWDWSSWLPRVRPQLGQRELENWSGAMRVDANVLLGSNEYLFGAIGEPNRLWIRTTPLPLYVLGVAGGMLVLGLIILQARREHRLWVMGAAGVAIAGAVLLDPSYGAIGGQVVVLGTGLVILAGVLRWLFREAAGRRWEPAGISETRVLPPTRERREPSRQRSTTLPKQTTAGVD